MRRRDFIARSGIAAGALAIPRALRARGKRTRQFIELRIYHFASPEKQQTSVHSKAYVSDCTQRH